jgi:nucleoside diphosphate kinase
MAKQAESKKIKLDGKAILSYGLKVAQDILGLTGVEETKKVTLNEIKMEDAQRGLIRLEHKQNTLLTELHDLEAQKRRLFAEGVQKSGLREQKSLAQQIKKIDLKMKNLDRTLEAIYIQSSVIDSFIMIKEQEQMNHEMGLQSIFGDMDLSELVEHMEKAMVDGQLNMTRLRDLAGDLNKHNYMGEVLSEDEDVREIMRQMQLAQADPETIETHYAEMDEKLAEKGKAQEDHEPGMLDEEV